MGYKINKAQNKSNCAYRFRQAGLRLLTECVKAYKSKKTSGTASASLSSRTVPVVRAKPDFGFSPNASKHTKARKQVGLCLSPSSRAVPAVPVR